ncbi:MAG: hypothetical protein NTZ36_01155 [Candidatus Jorgensenbacteria bacterium]|nr:hypothetical protein [Candidatus Jorgensenbacteria bacterium]
MGLINFLRNVFSRKKDMFKLNYSAVMIEATSGTETIFSARYIFDKIDPSFRRFYEPSKATPRISLVPFELQKDATFREMFEWIAKKFEKGLDDLCLTQHQIKEVAKLYPTWLGKSGAGTFILFKSKGQFWVAEISAKADGDLLIGMFILDYPSEWLSEFHHIVVVPKS